MEAALVLADRETEITSMRELQLQSSYVSQERNHRG